MNTRGIEYEKGLQDRRRALTEKRFSVQFYGGWYMVDNHSNATVSHTTFEQALDGAEEANKTGPQIHDGGPPGFPYSQDYETIEEDNNMPTRTLHGLSYCSGGA